jgi:hypothetical protein
LDGSLLVIAHQSAVTGDVRAPDGADFSIVTSRVHAKLSHLDLKNPLIIICYQLLEIGHHFV